MKVCNRCYIEKELSEFYCKEKINSKGITYTYIRPDCIQCVKEKAIIWQSENRDKWLAKCNKQNKRPEKQEQMIKVRKEYVESGGQTKWQQNNKNKIKMYNEIRSKKIHNISTSDWDECRLFFNYRCAYCGISYEEHFKKYKQDLHKDHVEPEGSNNVDNCIPSCRSCNSSKGMKKMDRWFTTRDSFTQERLELINKWLKLKKEG